MKGGKQRRARGNEGEDLAAEFLEEQGFRVLKRNYRFERGEIDLVCEERDELVFVEVKTRTSSLFGDPEDAVTEAKQRQIRAAADGWCFENEINDRFCRFDVVAVELRARTQVLRHIRNAF